MNVRNGGTRRQFLGGLATIAGALTVVSIPRSAHAASTADGEWVAYEGFLDALTTTDLPLTFESAAERVAEHQRLASKIGAWEGSPLQVALQDFGEMEASGRGATAASARSRTQYLVAVAGRATDRSVPEHRRASYRGAIDLFIGANVDPLTRADLTAIDLRELVHA